MSHKSEMAGPFNRGDTIINKHFLLHIDYKSMSSDYHIVCMDKDIVPSFIKSFVLNIKLCAQRSQSCDRFI